MNNLGLFMHTSLESFVARPNGEMDWITLDEEVFDYTQNRIVETNTILLVA